VICNIRKCCKDRNMMLMGSMLSFSTRMKSEAMVDNSYQMECEKHMNTVLGSSLQILQLFQLERIRFFSRSEARLHS